MTHFSAELLHRVNLAMGPDDEPTEERVAKQLREELRRAGLSQHELARRLGLTAGRVSQIFSGRENLTILTVDAVLHQCGTRLYLASREQTQ